MSASILVGYATRYGATKEVAEAVAAVLRERGQEVMVGPVKDVRSVEEYKAVVVGAPLYIGSLPGDAKQFLTRHQSALARRPLAVFSLGPLSLDEAEAKGAREQLDKELAKFPALKPVDVALWAGKYDPKTLRFPDSLLGALPASPLHGRPASDKRDWAAIRAWAAELPAKLGLGKTA
jgi:menaquinone-dependent protoporphyrinogen oxidase